MEDGGLPVDAPAHSQGIADAVLPPSQKPLEPPPRIQSAQQVGYCVSGNTLTLGPPESGSDFVIITLTR